MNSTNTPCHRSKHYAKRKTAGLLSHRIAYCGCIIGIIAAIAIPNLLASRRAANEGSAQSSLRTVHSCQLVYRATAGDGDYGDLARLWP